METEIRLPFPVKNIRIAKKSIPIYQNSTIVGTARVTHSQGKIMAKMPLKMDFVPYLTAMGELVSFDGDLIDEMYVDYLCVPNECKPITQDKI